MKSMTIKISFEDGQFPGDITFGSLINGGTVTAMACYDIFKTMEIAEAALERSTDGDCIDAIKKINAAIIATVETI